MAAITAVMTYPKDSRYNRSLSLVISLVAARGEFDPKASNRVDHQTASVTIHPLPSPDSLHPLPPSPAKTRQDWWGRREG